jgi:transcriptional regulator with XRE-family HTH domain
MGGLGSGRPADQARRGEALRLRAEGLTPAEIGRRLGVSRQRVEHVLRVAARERERSLACRACGGVAAPAGAAPADAEGVLCLACLGRWRGAPFAERLRSCRAAAGLRRGELARRAGLTPETVRFYEAGRQRPRVRHLLSLVRVLGPALVAPGERP